jgi:ribose transport system permease protein
MVPTGTAATNQANELSQEGATSTALTRKRALPQEVLLLAALIIIMAVFAGQSSAFLSKANLVDTAQSSTEVGLLAIGELFVIITAGIDLSVGATLGLCGVVGAILIRDVGGLEGLLSAIAAILAIGAAVGLFNGLIITRLNVSPFITTLASLGIVGGITLIISNGLDELGVSTGVQAFGQDKLLGGVLTWPIILTLGLGIYAGLVLRLGVFGQWTYAVGSNRIAARESGIDVRRHLVKVYILCSLFAATSGFVLMARLADGSPVSGTNDELSAITAVVIGGASLFGGRGTMFGTLLGVLLLSIVLDGLIIIGISPYWQTVATGLLLVAAVTVQNISRHGIRRVEGT